MKVTISALMFVGLFFSDSSFATHACTPQTGAHQCACEHRDTSSSDKVQAAETTPKTSTQKRDSWGDRYIDRR